MSTYRTIGLRLLNAVRLVGQRILTRLGYSVVVTPRKVALPALKTSLARAPTRRFALQTATRQVNVLRENAKS